MEFVSKKRKGISQRAQASHAEFSPNIESRLATFLTYQVVWGLFSPQIAQKIAHLATQDFSDARERNGTLLDLEKIAKTGNYGKLPNNVHRDLLSHLDGKTEMPQPFQAKIPFKDYDEDPVTSILLPHEVFAALYANYNGAWNKVIADGGDSIEEFWDAQENHPNMQDHPIRTRPDYKRSCIPIGLHGDEVPLTGKGKVWSKSLLTFEWCSLLGRGATTESVFWIWGMFEKLMTETADGTLGSLDQFFEILHWSLLWLWKGCWPTHDHTGKKYARNTEQGTKAGTPLAGGYYATVWGILGDLDYFAKTLKLPHHSSSSPCALCRCTLHGDATWRDNRANAAWLETIWKPLEWLQWPSRSKCKLFDLPGVTACTVCLDYMHSKYLGCDQYIFGSVLYMLCFVIMPLTPLENLKQCWAFIKRFYKNHGVKNKLFNLTKLSMFVRKKDYPKLRGKAAQIKAVGPAILALWTKLTKNSTDVMYKSILILLQANVKMEQILNKFANHVALPENEANEFLKCSRIMAQLLVKCTEHYLPNPDLKVFNITSKTHMVIHCALLAKYLNPRKVWCFSGEDFMRKVQRNGESRVSGTTAAQATVKMVSHYRVGLGMELREIQSM